MTDVEGELAVHDAHCRDREIFVYLRCINMKSFAAGGI